jgi:DNA polymerase-3 subunit delta'
VAHAYLFAGPRHVGKTSTALAFASALNCANPTPDNDACGNCLSCLRIEACTDADVQVISPSGNQTRIQQIHDMVRDLSYAPLSGKYRVFIIEQADTLNPSSGNAILKILEEPPPYAVLILISTNPNSLLPTIRSRCMVVKFKTATVQTVEEILRSQYDLSEEEIKVISACSQGALGRAIQMASDPSFMEERRFVLEQLKTWAHGPDVLSLRTAELLRKRAEVAKNDLDERTRIQRLVEMLEHILYWYADILKLKVHGEDVPLVNVDYREDLQSLAELYEIKKVERCLRVVMAARTYIEGNITPQLVLENMLLELHPSGV